MPNDKIWVQRRFAEWGDETIPEFIFNETNIDYFKFTNQELTKDELPDYYVEDRYVHGTYLGKDFIARLFRPYGHWFYGQESFGVEIEICLSLFFKTMFYKRRWYENYPKEPVLLCYQTGNTYNYCYDPTMIPGTKDKLVPYGQKCLYPKLIFDKSYHIYPDQTVITGDFNCITCPFGKEFSVHVEKARYVKCRIPEFDRWPEDEYLDREDYYKIIENMITKGYLT